MIPLSWVGESWLGESFSQYIARIQRINKKTKWKRNRR